MVFLLLVGGGDALQVVERIFVLADVVGLNVRLEYAFGGVVELVRVAPDGVAFLDVGGGFETFEVGLVVQIFLVVAVGDDVAGVGQRAVVKVRGVEAEKLCFANLLGVAE